MMSEPDRGRNRDDDLSAEPPAFSDLTLSEGGMRRIVYGEDRKMLAPTASSILGSAKSSLR